MNVVPVDRTGQGIGQTATGMDAGAGPGASANVHTTPRDMSKQA